MPDPERSAKMNRTLKEERYWQAVEKIRARIAEKITGECVVLYDAFDLDESGMPIDNLNSIAYQGTARLVDDCNDYFDGPVLTNPTWMEIAIHANAIMIATGDRHHVFLEEVYENKIDKSGMMDLSIGTGS